MDLRAIIARGFSVDFSGNNTQLSLAAPTNTNKMRSTMGPSLLGIKGPNIATTIAMTGQTLTADSAPFALCSWSPIQATNGAGTAVLLGAGCAGPMQDLYSCTAAGQHPVVLANNEGVLVQPAQTGPATGTWNYTIQWEWAEVVVF